MREFWLCGRLRVGKHGGIFVDRLNKKGYELCVLLKCSQYVFPLCSLTTEDGPIYWNVLFYTVLLIFTVDQSSQPVEKFDDILSNKPEDLKEYRPSKDCGMNSQSISCKNMIEVGWGPFFGKIISHFHSLQWWCLLFPEPDTTGSGGHLVNPFLLVAVAVATSVMKALRLIWVQIYKPRRWLTTEEVTLLPSCKAP